MAPARQQQVTGQTLLLVQLHRGLCRSTDAPRPAGRSLHRGAALRQSHGGKVHARQPGKQCSQVNKAGRQTNHQGHQPSTLKTGTKTSCCANAGVACAADMQKTHCGRAAAELPAADPQQQHQQPHGMNVTICPTRRDISI